jgi:hypothetical protein
MATMTNDNDDKSSGTWYSDDDTDDNPNARPNIPDVREVFSRWVDHNYDELMGAFDAMRNWLHATISPIMGRMTFDAFCRFAYEASRV